MDMALENLLKELTSGNKKRRDEAVLCLAMLLEKHSSRPDKQSNYELILPASLHSLSLSSEDQQAIIERLGDLIESKEMLPSMLWALGKTTNSAAVLPLLRFINQHFQEADDDAIWQALIAIENFLVFDSNNQLRDEVVDYLNTENPLRSFTEIGKRQNPDIVKLSNRVITKVAKSLEQQR